VALQPRADERAPSRPDRLIGATAAGSGSQASRRLRRLGETCLWLLVIGAAVIVVLHVAARLRLVVLPLALAIVLSTFLTPAVAWLRARGWRDGIAAFAVLAAALLVLAGVVALVVPPVVDRFADLEVGFTGGIDEIQEWLAESPLPLSSEQVAEAIDRAQRQLSESFDAIAGQVVSGAVLVVEALAGLLLAVVVLFFLLKDGERIWEWLVGLAPPARRADADAIGQRAWAALAGFMRGQTLVALFDALLIGAALAIIGVPLVMPLAVLTFFGAYVPVLGATVAGLLAVLVALVSNGVVAAAAVLAAILLVQQLEGNVFGPVVVGRAVHAHPVAILLGVTAGAVLAGVIGAMVAAPLVAVSAAVLRYLREAAGGAQPG
jgi:predicted PurR-regulated permease PerM